MLKLAFPYSDKLNKVWQSVVFEEKYQFYTFSDWWSYKIYIDDNSLDKLQMVSVDAEDNVIGFFEAFIERDTYKISAVSAINFKDINITFSKDFYQFMSELFVKHKFRKIEWFVVVGNPAEKLYDKIIAKYGGHIVGVKHETRKTADGILRDEKDYEIFKSDFDAYMTRKNH